MISKVTDAMVAIEGEAMRGVTWVRVHEVASGEWAIGGKPLTTADSKRSSNSRSDPRRSVLPLQTMVGPTSNLPMPKSAIGTTRDTDRGRPPPIMDDPGLGARTANCYDRMQASP